ncbi:hypothetical protein [Psychroflexus salis]|uniref:hypothetical protein n=1 Tax=Psychroflexus salis TaxID=1526574 RepID=UPI00166C5B23|nr:hypothetical protein [Psychroflexus salis]
MANIKKKENEIKINHKKIILVLTLTLLISCGFESSDKSNDYSTTKTKVENLKLNKENKYGWAVVGMIRNESSSSIKGFVKIKFLNSNKDIVYSTMARVNDGDYFGPGQAASFDYHAAPSKFDGVTEFLVEFVEK